MLKVDIEYKRGVLFIRLKGILNSNTYCKLSEVLERAIKDVGVKYIMINCEKLFSIDSVSISTINDLCLELIKNDGKLLFCGVNDYVGVSIANSELSKNIHRTNNEIGAFSIVNI